MRLSAGCCGANDLTLSPPPLSSDFTALQGLTRTTLAAGLSTAAPSMGFRAPLAHAFARGPVIREPCLPATVRPQGFLPPSRRFTPSRAWSALFQADSTYGVFPSEPSPQPRLPGVLRRCRPACRSLQASLRQTRDLSKLGPVARLPGASSGESLAAATSLTPPCRRLLPWVSSLSRVHFACLGRPFRRLILSRACRPPRLLASGLPCAAESQSADDLPGPVRPSALHRVSRRMLPGVRLLIRRPGLWVHLATPPGVATGSVAAPWADESRLAPSGSLVGADRNRHSSVAEVNGQWVLCGPC